jgi:hypothetical protein
MYLQQDGRVLVGGGFDSIDRTNIHRIARLIGDFTPSSGVSRLDAKAYSGVTISGTASNLYRIEYTTQLRTPSLWTPWTNVVLQSSPELLIDFESPFSKQRFYRAVELGGQ